MKQTSYGRFSSHRQSIMGIAILLIILCHNHLWFRSDWANQLNSYVRMLSQVGVDLFLFSSGYGLYYSYTRSASTLAFYKKRLIRILPAYLCATVFWALAAAYYGGDVGAFLNGFLPLGFYLHGDLTIWYVPACLGLYLLYPLAVPLIRSGKTLLLSCAAIGAASFCIARGFVPFLNSYTPMVINEILIVRLPVFLVGAYWGKCCLEGTARLPRIPRIGYALMALVLSALAMANMHILHGISWWWVNRLLFCPLVLCLLALLIPLLERDTSGRTARCLGFFGAITLELYLFQERLLLYLRDYILVNYQSPKAYLFSNILSIILAVGLSLAVHRLCALPFRPRQKQQ